MKTFFLFTTALLLSMLSQGQTTVSSISGLIKNSQNEIVPGATVQLVTMSDSSIFKTGLSDVNGRFNFSQLPYGRYALKITSAGQKKFISPILSVDSSQQQVFLPVVVLLPSTNAALAEVVIKAKRPLVVQEIDKTVINVESMISSASSNALEVLEKTPGITVRPNGEINLNGRSGVLVLIDGRATYMSGSDLTAYLKSLPGSLLDKLELMDNPPARYDASGNAVINIRFKRTRVAGFTGSLNAGYSQGKYARVNDGVNLNYNYKKINLFGNLGYTDEKSYSLDQSDRYFFNASNEPLSRVMLRTRQVSPGHAINSFLGADFSPSAATTWGIQLNLNNASRRNFLDYTSGSFSKSIDADSTGRGYTAGRDRRTNVGTNLNFTHRFKRAGQEIAADANYLHYDSRGTQLLENLVFDPGAAVIANNHFQYLTPSSISIYTVKADYTQPLSQRTKFDAGIKTSVVDNDNLTDYFNTNGPVQTRDNSQSNHFIYHENINAAYLNLQFKWKRFGVQAGLRAENTRSTGHQLGNDSVKESSFSKDYTQLFPSLFLNYKLDSNGNNSLTFSITRRINRPNYQALNPFQFMRDQYSYTAGNPLLSPQYQYRYELRYQYKQFLRMGLSYNRFTNIIFQTTEARGDTFITRPQNIAKGHMLLLNTGINLPVTGWWNFNADVLLSHVGLNGLAYSEVLNPSIFMARINILNQFQFGKSWTGEAGGYYASRDLSGQSVTDGMVRVNAGIQKKLLKEKASLRLSVDDLFHSWVYHTRSLSLKQAQAFQVSESDTQRIGISFSYRFGKNTFSRKSRHNDNASDDEKGRVE